MTANDNALLSPPLAARRAAVERVLDDILHHDAALAEAVERDGVAGARAVLADLSRGLVPRLRAALGLPANDDAPGAARG